MGPLNILVSSCTQTLLQVVVVHSPLPPAIPHSDQSARVGKILRRFYVATLWFLDSPRKLRCYAIAFHDPYEIYSCPHTLLNIDFHSSVDLTPYIQYILKTKRGDVGEIIFFVF